MKKFLFLPLLFAYFVGAGQFVNPASIIGKTIKLGDLVVAEKDFSKRMTWSDAKMACKALGKGWRLPTKSELKILSASKYIFRPFRADDNTYWSSTPYNYFDGGDQSFAYALDYDAGTFATCNVRAVKGGSLEILKTANKNIIGKTIKIGSIEIAQYDFSEEMNWEDANKACQALGKGWRLPTKNELNVLYQNKAILDGFEFAVNPSFKYYWSSSVYNKGRAWNQNIIDGLQYHYNKFDSYFVRAIRSF
jgi:hypothetical protein